MPPPDRRLDPTKFGVPEGSTVYEEGGEFFYSPPGEQKVISFTPEQTTQYQKHQLERLGGIPKIASQTGPGPSIRANLPGEDFMDTLTNFTRTWLSPILKGGTQELAAAGAGAATGLVTKSPVAAFAAAVPASGAAAAGYDMFANAVAPRALGYTKIGDEESVFDKLAEKKMVGKGVGDYLAEGAVDRAGELAVRKLIENVIPRYVRTAAAMKAGHAGEGLRGAAKLGLAANLPGMSISPEIAANLTDEQARSYATRLNPDIAQLHGGWAETLRDIFTSKKTLETQQKQQSEALTGQVNEVLSRPRGTATTADTGNMQLAQEGMFPTTRGDTDVRSKVRERLSEIRRSEGRLHDNFRDVSRRNVTQANVEYPNTIMLNGQQVQAPPTIRQEVVEAPVRLTASVAEADRTLTYLTELIAEEQRLGTMGQGNPLRLARLGELFQSAQKIRSAPVETRNGVTRVIPAEVAKVWRNAAYDIPGLEKFGNTLYADFRRSMGQWGNSTEAIAAYDKAARATDLKMSLDPLKAHLKPAGNPEDLITGALQSGTDAARAKAAGVDVRVMATALLRDAFHGAQTPEGIWKPAQILEYLTKKSDVYNQVTNADQRNQIEYLLKRMEMVGKPYSQAGKYLAWLKGGSAAVTVAASFLGNKISPYPMATSAGTLGLLPMGYLINKGIVLDPMVSRTLVQLSQAPAGSTRGQELFKRLLLAPAMQGVRVETFTPTGVAVHTIVDKGQLVPEKKAEAPTGKMFTPETPTASTPQ